MAQSLQFFRRIMLLLNITVCVFLAWVFGMTPVLAARQSDGVAFTQNLSSLPAKPWTLTVAILSMAALIVVGVLRRRSYHFVGWAEPLFALCVIFALHHHGGRPRSERGFSQARISERTGKCA